MVKLFKSRKPTRRELRKTWTEEARAARAARAALQAPTSPVRRSMFPRSRSPGGSLRPISISSSSTPRKAWSPELGSPYLSPMPSEDGVSALLNALNDRLQDTTDELRDDSVILEHLRPEAPLSPIWSPGRKRRNQLMMQRILNAELRKSPDLASTNDHFKSNTGRRVVSRTLKSSDSCPSIESVLSSSPCMDLAPDPKTSDAGVFGFTAAGPSLPLRVHLPESSQVQLRHSLPTIKPSPVSGLRNTASVFSGRAHGAGVPPIKSKPKTGEPVTMVATKPAPAHLSSGASSLERRTGSWRTSDTPVAIPVRSTNAVGDRAPRSVKCAEKKPEVPPLLLPNIVEGTSNVFSDTPTRDRKGPPAVSISRGSGRSSRKQSEVAKPTEPGRIRLSARFDHKPTPSPPPVRRTSPSCPSRPSPAPLLTPASTRRPPSTASKTSADHADSLARRTSTAPLPGPAKPSITMGRPLAVAPNAHNTRSARSAGSHAKKEQCMKAFPSPDVTTVSSIAMVAPRKTDHVHAVKSASSLKVASRQSAIPGHVKTSAPARNIGTEVVVVHASLPVRKSLRSLRARLVLLGSRVSLVKPSIRVVAVRSAQALKVHVRKSGVLDGFSTCQFELFSKIILPELLEPSEAVGVPCYLPASDPTRSRTRTKSARAQPAPTFASVDIPQPTQMAGVQPLPMKRTTNLPAKRGPLSGSAILTLLRGKDFSEDGLVLWESPRQDAPNQFPDASCADKYDIDVEADADAAILAMLVQSTPRHWRQEPKGIQVRKKRSALSRAMHTFFRVVGGAVSSPWKFLWRLFRR